jgi:hypothetical protein
MSEMKGWKRISKKETPQWVLNKAYKIAQKHGRKYGSFTFAGKHYKYFIESLNGADGYICYRKLKYGDRIKEEKKRLVYLLIVAVILILILGIIIFFHVY